MSEVSCLKFDKSWANEHFQRHNFREISPDYLLKNPTLKNEYETVFDPKTEYKKIDFDSKKGRKVEYAHSIKEAVLLLKDGTRLSDIKETVSHIEQTLNIKCCSIAIHNDEGHIEDSKTVYNTHAHLVFYTLDKDGKQNFRLTKIRPKLSALQREIADKLGMKRPETGSKRRGLTANQFRQVAKEKAVLTSEIEVKKAEIEQLQNENQKLKSRLLTKKEQTGFLGLIRKNWIKDGTHSQEEYKQLSALKQKTYTQEELDKAIAELNAQHEQRMTDLQESSIRSFTTLQEQFQDAKNKLTSEIEVKNTENEELQKQNQSLSLRVQELETQLAEKPKEIVKTETVDRELNQSEIEKIVLDADDSLIEQHRHFKNTREKLRSDANVLTVESLRAQHKDDVAEIDKLRDANRKLVLSRKSSYTQRIEIIKSATEDELKEHSEVYQRLQTRLNNLIKTAKTGFVKILKVFGLSAGDEDYLMHSADTSYVANKAVESVENHVSDTEELHAEQSKHRSFHM